MFLFCVCICMPVCVCMKSAANQKVIGSTARFFFCNREDKLSAKMEN